MKLIVELTAEEWEALGGQSVIDVPFRTITLTSGVFTADRTTYGADMLTSAAAQQFGHEDRMIRLYLAEEE